MNWAQRMSTALGWGLVVGLLPLLVLAAPPVGLERTDKIDLELQDQIAVAGQADLWIGLEEQADLSAAYDMDWQARGRYVYQTLAETARKSQAGVIAYLEAQGLAYESFWINNSIHVRGGSLPVVQDLAARSEVTRLKADDVFYLPEPPADGEPSEQRTYDDWGLAWIHAPDVWGLGYDGAGIVVANIDTGVQYNHPQLDETYRGAIDGSDQYNWCDPSDICSGDTPCDNYGHGTHVMGTLSGENDDPVSNPNLIGVAPGSTWIACKGCEGDTCSDLALTECAQWIAAPTELMSGNCGSSLSATHDPDKRPHVVNNSWGDTASDPWFQTFVRNWQAFGIFPAFSAGNQNFCGSAGSPGDYPESFSSANIQSNGIIHPSYSSRGPSSFGSIPYCKPNIAAPGTGIYSSVPTNLYGYFTGTSMASPHSAGTVALLWQACPTLLGQVDLTFQILQNSAGVAPADPCASTTGCADAGCNCTYGYGYLDAHAAVMNCPTGGGSGYASGYVYRQSDGEPISGASVTISPTLSSGSTGQVLTDPQGYYTTTLTSGTYDLTASKAGYAPETHADLAIVGGLVTHQDFHLLFVGSRLYMPIVFRNSQE
jgi:subtilisin family serine protease